MNEGDPVIYMGMECEIVGKMFFENITEGYVKIVYILDTKVGTKYASRHEISRLPHPDKAAKWDGGVWKPEELSK